VQVNDAPGTQVPPPSQVEANVLIPSTQLWGAQMIPAAYLPQPPAPLQAPSLPQLAAPWSRQAPVGSWPPSGTKLQVPAVPETLQDMQLPSQRLLQQTPSAQKLDAQSSSRPHRLPMGCLPHVPPMQTFWAEHSFLVVHEVPQRLPLHMKGVQGRASGTAHAPLRQTPSAVHSLVAGLHVCSRQVVPLG
jgi:hypothetical protein